MSATADHMNNPAVRLGFQPGQVVQEIGHGEDADQQLRDAVEEVTGLELADDTHGDVADVVLVWWREDDGDLTDTLVDARDTLADGGLLLLLTPKTGRDGHVEGDDITSAAQSAGLALRKTVAAGADWTATFVNRPGATARGR